MDAAKLLHGIFRGDLLQQSSIEAILERSTILDKVVPGRPWTKVGYALGLMSGSMGNVGRAWGHSGSGPHSSNAIYHFPDLDRSVTVATFADTETEGPAEFEALAIATRMQES
jgi:hypothetical protein